eukprot:SAG22_NODE_2404_length_2611_cov_1.592357_1_plen_719_part_10
MGPSVPERARAARPVPMVRHYRANVVDPWGVWRVHRKGTRISYAIMVVSLVEAMAWSSSSVALGVVEAGLGGEAAGGDAGQLAEIYRGQYGRSVENLKLLGNAASAAGGGGGGGAGGFRETGSGGHGGNGGSGSSNVFGTQEQPAWGAHRAAGQRLREPGVPARMLGNKRPPKTSGGSSPGSGGAAGGGGRNSSQLQHDFLRISSATVSKEGDLEGLHAAVAPPRNGSDPVQKWLAALNFSLPAQSFVVAGINGSIANMYCDHIDFDSVQSSSAAKPKPGFSMSVSGVSIACLAHWSYYKLSAPKLLHGKGNIVVQVRQASFDAGIQLTVSKSNGLAKSCTMDKCGISLGEDVKVEFPDSGLTGDILDLFKGTIIDVVRVALDTAACGELKLLAANNISAGLQAVDGFVAPYMHPPAAKQLPHAAPGTEDLRQSATAALVNYGANELIGSNINRIMRTLTEGTGRISLDKLGLALPAIPIAGLANLTLTVTAVDIAGLDSWGGFRPAAAAGHSVLRSELALGRLELNVSFTVTVRASSQISAAGTLVEYGHAAVALSNSRLHALTLVAVEQDKVDNLAPTQFTSPGCILSSLRNVSVLSAWLNFTVDELSITSVSEGAAEAGLDGAIDNFISLWTETFDAAIPALLDGLLTTAAVPAANAGLAAALSSDLNLTCGPPTAQKTSDWTGTYVGFSCAAGLYVFLFVFLRGFQARQVATAAG